MLHCHSKRKSSVSKGSEAAAAKAGISYPAIIIIGEVVNARELPMAELLSVS